MELAALALPAHPASLALVPDAPAMQQQEALAAGRRSVAPVEPRDAVGGDASSASSSVDVLRSPHPASPTAARNAARRPDWRGSESPAARSAPRSPRASVSSVGHGDQRAQMRRDAVAQRQARQAASRRSRAVTPRLTSAIATSIAGTAPSKHHQPRAASRPKPTCARTEQRHDSNDRGRSRRSRRRSRAMPQSRAEARAASRAAAPGNRCVARRRAGPRAIR